jgi:hypothetical protein
MSNSFNNLVATVYTSLDTVSRELVGFIPAVTRDPVVARAAIGQTIMFPIAPASTSRNIVPGQLPPDDGDQTIGNSTLTITKQKAVPFRWTGEENLSLNNGGIGRAAIQQDQISQALRTLTNEMEADLAGLYLKASRAYGTATTTPFSLAANVGVDTALTRKILDDNGVPVTDRQLIISTGAGANLRSHSQLTKANESGDPDLLRQGTLLNMNGFAIRESAQIARPSAGTLANATTNAAGYAIGATAITLATAGTGLAVAGDIITFAGDINKYVVASVSFASAAPAAGDIITIAKPGLKQAISAAATAITEVAVSTRNLAFTRSALILANRLPAKPDEGDSAKESAIIVDPVSGIPFELAMYTEYKRVHYELAAAWGVACVKPENLAILLGE